MAGIALGACLLLLALASIGCQTDAPLPLTSTSTCIAYYYKNAAEKTSVYDMETMTKAALLTLKRMGFTLGKQSKDEKGERKIKAEAKELNIAITLKKITPKCTRMRVAASEDAGVLDKATALEIIFQTEKTAELLTKRRHEGS